ncbi:MAG: hypothetical protein GXO39_00205 [Thermotogae bacterium]|nr:hypothetical protein [Thermotogota bacterium]
MAESEKFGVNWENRVIGDKIREVIKEYGEPLKGQKMGINEQIAQEGKVGKEGKEGK